MSRKEIKITVIQCDHTHEDGTRCEVQGQREAIRICCVCGKDFCETHSDLNTVTSTVVSNGKLQAGRHRYLYSFCKEHTDQFVEMIIEKFGNNYEVPATNFMLVPGSSGTHYQNNSF
ncbi:MAG: hypothetical protein AAF462_02180 [Thermodesulfobacteriota bacterium]